MTRLPPRALVLLFAFAARVSYAACLETGVKAFVEYRLAETRLGTLDGR